MSYKKPFDRKAVILLLRIIIGGFFLLTAILKLTIPVEEVHALVRTFKILPAPFDYWFAVVMPWIELIPALMLIRGKYPLLSITFIMGLTLIFIFGILSVIIRGIPLEDCGCLGGFIQESPSVALWRDIGIFILSIPVLRFYLKNG